MPIGAAESEFAKNPEPRCPCVLLLDTSGSMKGNPITEMNDGIQILKSSLQGDSLASLRVEVAIITFGGSPAIQQPFTTVDQFYPQWLDANGDTPMGAGIHEAVKLLDSRKQAYKKNGISYYRPWIFLITDGAPTDDWQTAKQLIHDGEAKKRHVFFAVGVEGADMNTLTQIAPPNRPPLMLKGLAFDKLFQWLSVSLSSASKEAVKPAGVGGQDTAMQLAPVDGWASVSTSS